jgi:hypothetical protein
LIGKFIFRCAGWDRIETTRILSYASAYAFGSFIEFIEFSDWPKKTKKRNERTAVVQRGAAVARTGTGRFNGQAATEKMSTEWSWSANLGKCEPRYSCKNTIRRERFKTVGGARAKRGKPKQQEMTSKCGRLAHRQTYSASLGNRQLTTGARLQKGG